MASNPSSSSSSSYSIHPTDAFISKLRTAASAEKALIRPTEFYIESNQVDSNSYNVTGWKTQEFAYRLNSKLDSRLPTLARGLFTTKVHHSDTVEANQDGAQSPSNQQNRIAVRGYDKFFNLDEMPWTSQASIERYSAPPYLLTFKENGCIIFISSLSSKRLLVTSKNSLGKRPEFRDPRQINKVSNGIQDIQEEEEKRSHSEVGEEWLEKHLKSVGRTKEELAEVLWKRDETAVFELCDDSFEEHVLSYPLQRSGLHLHGLNSNSSTFKTQHMEVVDSFAEEWGFIKTRWLQMDTMTELKKFTEEVGKTGRWEGEGIEGFVVRTTMKEEDEEQITNHQDQKDNNHGIIKSKKIEKPPYEKGMAFFYKIKFDEPYLMYREWREMTRKMLASHQSYQAELETCTAAAQKAVEGQIRGLEKKWMASNPNRSPDEKFELPKEGPGSYEAILKSKSKKPDIPKLPSIRSNRPQTHVFVQWVQDILYGTQQSERKTHTEPKPTPEIFSKFHQTKGIIATRETFIKYLQTEEGQSRLRSFQVKSGNLNLSSIRKQDSRPFEKVLLAPIAVVGCGKTSVCRALEQLFGWKMEQSDDIKTKKTGPTFLRNVNESLSLPLDEEGNDIGEQLESRRKKSIGKGKGKGVIADRNNLLFVHREELVNLVAKYESLVIKPKVNPSSSNKSNSTASTSKDSQDLERKAPQRSTGLKVRMIALAYRIEPPLSEIRRICLSRIEKRGDNHQNIRISDGKEAVQVLLDKFLKDFQPFNDAWIEGSEDSCDNGFDDVIHLDVEDDLLTSVTKVVDELIKLGVIEENERPSEKEINDAVSYSESYQIGGEDRKTNTAISKLQQREETARYYAIQLEMNLEQIMRELIKDVQEESKKVELEQLVEVLNRENTWIKEPHVTLVHGESVAKEKKWIETEGKENILLDSDAIGAIKRWDLISSKLNDDPKSQSSNQNSNSQNGSQALPIAVSLDLVAWNSRAISLKVSSIHCQDSKYFSLEQMEINQDTILHVTVGTTAVEIRPYEGAKVLKEVEKVRKGEKIDGTEVPRWLALKKELAVKGCLKGMK